MSNIKQAVPFFWVADITASIEFYAKGLGFELNNSWAPEGKMRWCWLEGGEAAIMLQEFRKDGQNPKANRQPGDGVDTYFNCEDALKIYDQIIERGLSVSEPFVGNNMWVVSLRDPDGYKISFLLRRVTRLENSARMTNEIQ